MIYRKRSILANKALDFSVKIHELNKQLKEVYKEYEIAGQILRSGTSIGANICEGQYAQSCSDFINKYSIARKEAAETLYWLDYLERIKVISAEQYELLYGQGEELLKMLTAAILSKMRGREETGNNLNDTDFPYLT